MHPNAELIQSFYSAFARRDAAAMVTAYHPNVQFSDAAFGQLDARHVRGMWHMLCERGKDLRLESSGIEANDTTGRAHWEAHYTFSATGRHVHNVLDATFTFADGKIIRHDDVFDFWRWSRMALGLPGVLLGWTPFLQNKVRKMALAGLEEWLREHPES